LLVVKYLKARLAKGHIVKQADITTTYLINRDRPDNRLSWHTGLL
jgi:hypothetical protein